MQFGKLFTKYKYICLWTNLSKHPFHSCMYFQRAANSYISIVPDLRIKNLCYTVHSFFWTKIATCMQTGGSGSIFSMSDKWLNKKFCNKYLNMILKLSDCLTILKNRLSLKGNSQ